MAFPLAPYLALLAASAVLTGLLAAYAGSHRDGLGTDWFAALMALCTLWILAVFGMVLARPRDVEVLMLTTGTAVGNVVPVVWFGFVIAYTGRERLFGWRTLVAVLAVPTAVNLVLVGAPESGLFFGSLEQVPLGGRTVLTGTAGPLSVLVFVHNYLLFAVGLWFVGSTLWDHGRLFAGQAFWVFVGSVVPIVAGMAELLEVGPAGVVPVIPVSFVVTGLAYGYALYRHRLLDLVPATRTIGEESIVENLAAGVVIVGDDGTIVRVNGTAERRFDRPAADLLGTPVDEFLAEVGGIALADVPAEFRHGGRRYEVTASEITSSRAERVGRTLLFRDVTKHRGRKQRLAVLNRVLRHNIRNSMNGVVGHARILEERLDGEDREIAVRIADMGEDVVELGEKARTVEQLLDRADDPRPVALAGLVESVCRSVDPGDRATVDVAVPEDATVVTDRATLAVVLENVVENAVEHGSTRAGSTGRDERVDGGSAGPGVQTRSDPVRDRAESVSVTVTAEPADGGYVVVVADDGPGIPDAELEALNAETETPLQHATGLGLWIVTWGMRGIGGDVRFASSADGTRVTLRVPDLDGHDRTITGERP